MNEYDMEVSFHQQYDHEAKQREDKWNYRADEPDHKDTEAFDKLTGRDEWQPLLDKLTIIDTEAEEQVEQERNVDHAHDNQI